MAANFKNKKAMEVSPSKRYDFSYDNDSEDYRQKEYVSPGKSRASRHKPFETTLPEKKQFQS